MSAGHDGPRRQKTLHRKNCRTKRIDKLAHHRSKNGRAKPLERITVNPNIFGGKPIIRGRRLAVEHVLGMLAAGDTPDILLQGYPWLEREDIQACLVYARRVIGHERIEPLKIESAA